MSQQEQWRQIKGFEGLYDVSDKGRVWSRKRNKIMSPAKNRHGYLQIHLCKNRKDYNEKVHRLVATHFIPNPEGYPEINHIDEDKSNNNIENLEWVSGQYNNEFSKSKAYVLYGPDNERIEIYNINKFARETGLHVKPLWDVAEGRTNSYHGYTAKPNTEYTPKRKGEFKLTSPDGEIFTFNSQKEAVDYLGLSTGGISELLKGKRKSCKGWTRAD